MSRGHQSMKATINFRRSPAPSVAALLAKQPRD
jgi:hypothetical protein